MKLTKSLFVSAVLFLSATGAQAAGTTVGPEESFVVGITMCRESAEPHESSKIQNYC